MRYRFVVLQVLRTLLLSLPLLQPKIFPFFPPSIPLGLEMAPKFDPNQVIEIYLRVTGGEIGAASSLAPKIGPLGLSPKKVRFQPLYSRYSILKGYRMKQSETPRC